MRLEFSTDKLPECDRFPFWADAMHGAMGVRRLPLAGRTGPFQARVSARSIGSLVNLKADTDRHRVLRQAPEISRHTWDTYWVYREAGPGVQTVYGGLDHITCPGDLLLLDSDIPLDAQSIDRFRYETWLIPKSLLNPYLPATRGPLLARLSDSSGMGALAASYLESLTRNADSLPQSALEPAIDILARLLGIACGAAAKESHAAVQAGRLAEAKRHIRRHLSDPAVSPATVAAALGISVRTLHEAFAPEGISFARYVQHCRLQECRAAVLAQPGRPILDIAFAWGFSSMSSFYRAFQAAFGMAPGDLREARRDQGAS